MSRQIRPPILPAISHKKFINPTFHINHVDSRNPTLNYVAESGPNSTAYFNAYAGIYTGPAYTYGIIGPTNDYLTGYLKFLTPYNGSDKLYFSMSLNSTAGFDGGGDSAVFNFAAKLTALSVDFDIENVTWNTKPVPAVDDYTKTFKSQVATRILGKFIGVQDFHINRFVIDPANFPNKPIYGFSLECYAIDPNPLASVTFATEISSIAMHNPTPQKTLNITHRQSNSAFGRRLTCDAPHGLIVGVPYFLVLSGIDDVGIHDYTPYPGVMAYTAEYCYGGSEWTAISSTVLESAVYTGSDESVDCTGKALIY